MVSYETFYNPSLLVTLETGEHHQDQSILSLIYSSKIHDNQPTGTAI